MGIGLCNIHKITAKHMDSKMRLNLKANVVLTLESCINKVILHYFPMLPDDLHDLFNADSDK